MTRQSGLLLKMLHQPGLLRSLGMADWDRILPLARCANLLGRLAACAEEERLFQELPTGPRWHLHASTVATAHNHTAIRWQIRCIARALAGSDYPIVLLKGAAYLAAELPPERGRRCLDVDLLVKKESLASTEAALRRHGWKFGPLHPLHEKYMRTELHELPPLLHPDHAGSLDLHHNILPATDSLHVDPEKLFAAAIPLTPGTRFRILAPCDMVLHAAAHLFRNGKFDQGLRDLVDLDDLLRHFRADPAFWDRLVVRAAELNLKIPCFWSLRYVERFLLTQIPEQTKAIVRNWRPALPPMGVMDRIVERAALPPENGNDDGLRKISRLILGYYPPPRLSAMASPVFWLKRMPWARAPEEKPVA